jgi:hypothetical protein
MTEQKLEIVSGIPIPPRKPKPSPYLEQIKAMEVGQGIELRNKWAGTYLCKLMRKCGFTTRRAIADNGKEYIWRET